MGKAKKLKKYGDSVPKPQPLSDQITLENEATPSCRVKHQKVDNDDKFVDGTLGQSIVKQSLAQLQELNEEEFPSLGRTIQSERDTDVNVSLVKEGVKKTFRKRKRVDGRDEEDSDAESVDEIDDAIPLNVEKTVKDFEDQLDLDNEDLKILDHFKKKESSSRQKRLADLFSNMITGKHNEIESVVYNRSEIESKLKPETKSQCEEIGKVLRKYRSGPLPKMLKTFPIMSCWDELLYFTKPENWTAAAMYQITRLFVSNLQAHLAQQFCTFVLLPRIRDDISYYKRLNFHLYQALSKTLYKPAAFFKGIIFPLCSNGDCSLREAIIIASLLANAHIPVAHSAAAISKNHVNGLSWSKLYSF
ncbi:Bystin [Armadillidium nasatum]|uniref:Bystin n=1 Tax=Armadillidium nasatum TaxID=96803 RepID=A0A5N5SXW5_9CRUS|nr:Bystin [Armadillidium nasatum]